MTDQEIQEQSIALQEMLASKGGRILVSHIEELKTESIEKFIALPVDKKTSKAAFAMQSEYTASAGLLDWIESEIKRGK